MSKIIGYVTWGYSLIVPVYDIMESERSCLVRLVTPMGEKLAERDDIRDTPIGATSFGMQQCKAVADIYRKKGDLENAKCFERAAFEILDAKVWQAIV